MKKIFSVLSLFLALTLLLPYQSFASEWRIESPWSKSGTSIWNSVTTDKVGIGTTTPIGQQQTVISTTSPAIFGGAMVGSYSPCTFPTANKDYVNYTGIGTASTVGDLVIITAGTGAYTGMYSVIAKPSADSIQLNRTCHNSGTDITDGAVSISTAPNLAVGTNRIYANANLVNATGNETAFKFEYTTNKLTSDNDTGLLINQIDTLSPGTSLLQNWQVGGVTKANLNNAGTLYSTKLLLPQVNEPAAPTLSFGDGDSGLYEASDDALAISFAGNRKYSINSSYFSVYATGAAMIVTDVASATVPVFTFDSDTNTGIGKAAADQLSLIAGGVEGTRIITTVVGTGQTVATTKHNINATLGKDTTDEVAMTLSYTTNKLTSGNDTGLLINMTDTASPGLSKVFDTQVAGAELLGITNKGHVIVDDAVTGSYPTLSACGTSPTLTAGSNDFAGTFTIGATGTGCTITFGTAYTNAPACICSGAAAITNSQTNAVLTVVAVPGTYNYICVGLNSGI